MKTETLEFDTANGATTAFVATPENIDERNDEIYKWSNKNKDLLDKNENRFWEQADDLEMSLLAHINKFFA